MSAYKQIQSMISRMKESKSNTLVKNATLIKMDDNVKDYKEEKRTIVTKNETLDFNQMRHLIDAVFNSISADIKDIDNKNQMLSLRDDSFLSYEVAESDYHVHLTIKYKVIDKID